MWTFYILSIALIFYFPHFLTGLHLKYNQLLFQLDIIILDFYFTSAHLNKLSNFTFFYNLQQLTTGQHLKQSVEMNCKAAMESKRSKKKFGQ